MDEWGVMRACLERNALGLLLLNVGNLNNEDAPSIQAYSVFSVNGSVYRCTTDENINGSVGFNARNYVYATANDSTASFSYSTEEPKWNAAKGGWYNNNGNSRAVLQFYHVPSTSPDSGIREYYNNKVILDSINAKNLFNEKQRIPLTGGTVVFTMIQKIQSPALHKITLAPGAYRYEMRGGYGGKGGRGFASGFGLSDEMLPKEPSAPGIVAGTFFLSCETVVYCQQGLGGGDGGNGKGKNGSTSNNGNGWNHGGGGSGANGGTTFMIIPQGLITAPGARGTAGTAGVKDNDANGNATNLYGSEYVAEPPVLLPEFSFGHAGQYLVQQIADFQAGNAGRPCLDTTQGNGGAPGGFDVGHNGEIRIWRIG